MSEAWGEWVELFLIAIILNLIPPAEYVCIIFELRQFLRVTSIHAIPT